MSNVNTKRVVSGGVTAGLVIFAITGVVNGAILSGQLQAWTSGMADHIHPPALTVALCLWFIMSCLLGTCGVRIYAGIDSRSKSRALAAVQAGSLVWIVSKVAVALDFLALGLLPASIVAGQLIGGLVAILIGVYAGARVYRE
jgi:hypothetical protein